MSFFLIIYILEVLKICLHLGFTVFKFKSLLTYFLGVSQPLEEFDQPTPGVIVPGDLEGEERIQWLMENDAAFRRFETSQTQDQVSHRKAKSKWVKICVCSKRVKMDHF